MAGVWVFANIRGGSFRKVIFEMLGEGRKIANHLGEELTAVLLGNDIASFANILAEYGADKVLIAEDTSLGTYTTDAFAKVTADLIKEGQPSVVMFAHNAIGKDLAPAVAQKIGAGQVSDVIQVIYADQLAFRRPIYAGKAFANVVFNTKPMITTIRAKMFEAAEPQAGRSAEVIKTSPSVSDIRQVVRDVVRKASVRVELTEADIVVSGGRGMKSGENFAILEELADVLGAAIGASRAAVDEGWREPQYQVGQTGKVVAPSLYIACGISGAIQHLAGMGSSKVIVAVNKDPEAEIFKVADYGIVGDLFQVVPILTQEFKKILAD
ncbi:MAG: electron transfer flavoprotein subunit alpha/FixB family protein [Carboxydocellales bacterium]